VVAAEDLEGDADAVTAVAVVAVVVFTIMFTAFAGLSLSLYIDRFRSATLVGRMIVKSQFSETCTLKHD
jgi:hypothetical protein